MLVQDETREVAIEEEEEEERVVNSELEMDSKYSEESQSPETEYSPRGVLEIPIMAGMSSTDSESGNSNNSSGSSNNIIVNNEKTTSWKSVIEALKRNKSVRRLASMPMEMSRRRSGGGIMRRKLARIRSADDRRVDVEEDVECVAAEGLVIAAKPSWRSYDRAELAAATAGFSPENLLGKGGQAEVYKGHLSGGQVVAVKRLTKKMKENEERIGDFLSELGIIAHIDHPNAARLLGFGVDGGFHLVLEFSPHGSLASLLFGSECLEWKIRFKVANGVAQGLQYLHHNCQRRIIHRDIKASNILLTQDYEAQISDFGLAKWLPEKWTHHVVFPIEGTFGYLAPEYFMHGIIYEKTDVFSYGVLLLELITGRRAVDSSQQSLVIWAKPLLESNSIRELADPRLGDDFDEAEMKRVMLIASMCLHHQSSKRPYMNKVVTLLKGEDGQIELKPKSSSATRSVMLEACDMEDYTCSTYLNDLNRHRQLVME